MKPATPLGATSFTERPERFRRSPIQIRKPERRQRPCRPICASERSYLALHEPLPPPLTPEDLATSADVSAATIRRRIKQARVELFGPLGTSGIYARHARARVLQERPTETCAAPECERPLPYDRTRRRRYCGPRCRVRAHRERCRDGSNSAA